MRVDIFDIGLYCVLCMWLLFIMKIMLLIVIDVFVMFVVMTIFCFFGGVLLNVKCCFLEFSVECKGMSKNCDFEFFKFVWSWLWSVWIFVIFGKKINIVFFSYSFAMSVTSSFINL